MQALRKFVLTVAGFDPSGGAGILADVKTFEQHHTIGLAVCSGLTLQTSDTFYSVEWRNTEIVKKEIITMLEHYPVKAIKFGIVPSFEFLNELVDVVNSFSEDIPIIIDPVLKSSTGFNLNQGNKDFLKKILTKATLITPNYEEIKLLSDNDDAFSSAKTLSYLCPVLLKGGHNEKEKGTDYLYYKNETHQIKKKKDDNVFPKHGSGCVLSSAITANIVNGHPLLESCILAKEYVENFLSTNSTLIGYHAK
ncbi:MAG: hydroxymethylpyrimidine/phosphomethylpyrimidine kinase [Bacteroidota bacterium]|nr:hydroxymethylpyrimidine/phosphomethylpyrimidine kinase [Bacteroidota bacterium]